MTEPSDTTWAVVAHLSHLVVFVGIPGFIGPLVVWLLKRNEDPFAAGEAREALNFHLSLLIYTVALFVALLLAFFDATISIFVLIGLAFAFMAVGSLVFPIVAAVRASGGERYRYPLTLRFF